MQSISGTSGATGALSMSDAITMLTSQLRNQDPMNPTDNSQLVTQMTQITNSQQLSQMSATLQTMVSLQRLTEASSLIGKTVTLTDSTTGQAVTGAVTAVTVQNGTPAIVVNGQELPLDSVSRIAGGA